MIDLRLCCFGDSFTNGTCDAGFLGWPARVAAAVQDRHVGARGLVTLYNLGIRRDTSADILARWRGEAERRLPAGVAGRLIFSFGINDVVDDGSGAPRIAAGVSERNSERILGEAAGWRPTLMITPPPITLPDQPRLPARLGVLCGQVGAICARLGIPCIDLHAALAGHPEWAREMAAGDGVHPNAAGYERLARIILGWPGWGAWVAGE
jgi:lysophospholipase L1-like esterase